MKTEQQTKTPGSDTPRPAASPVAAGRSKLQRSPLLIVFGVLVLAAGAAFGWFMWATTSTASEVVAVKADVQRGQIINAEDLTTVRVTLDPSLRTVPASDLQTLVGKRAATDLSAGTLVSPDQVTDVLLPPTGMSVVAVPIDAGLVPTVPILAGDTVRL
ncbi:MAG: SAF domain-containing protein, partial [Propionibacteriaceae bacterium]|nr:SAF domain-containing protein [Propionibacteriaceae bacterium]